MAGFGDRYNIDVVINAQNSDPWMSTVNHNTWADSVQKVLETIAAVRAGAALLKAIQAAGKWIAIIPPDTWKPATDNAETLDLHAGKNPHWAGRNLTYFSAVAYDPLRFTSPAYVTPGTPRFAGRPDEVLFHELVHAFRIITGARGSGMAMAAPMASYYDNTEEFLAIVLANIYVSDVTNKHGSGLRASHHGHWALGADIDSSVKFFKAGLQVLTLLREFAARHRALAMDLCELRAAFNPVRALFDPSLAKLLSAMSNSSYAANRASVEGMVTPILDVLGRRVPPTPDASKLGRVGIDIASELAKQALRVLHLTVPSH